MRPRLAPVVALAWVAVAVGLTVVLAPTMGYRGWMWLAVHHWACAIGAGWELVLDYRRSHSAQTRADS